MSSGQTIEVRLHRRLQAGAAAGAPLCRGMIGMAATAAGNRRVRLRHFRQSRRHLLRVAGRTGQDKSISQNAQTESQKKIRHGRQAPAQRARTAQTTEKQAAQHIQSRRQPAPTDAALLQVTRRSLILMKQSRAWSAAIMRRAGSVACRIVWTCLGRERKRSGQAVISGSAGADHEADGEGNNKKPRRFAHSQSHEKVLRHGRRVAGGSSRCKMNNSSGKSKAGIIAWLWDSPV